MLWVLIWVYLPAFIALPSGIAVSGYVAEYGDTCVGVCLSLCICEPQLRASDVGKIPQTARVSLRMSLY